MTDLTNYIEPDDSTQLSASELEKVRPLAEAAADRLFDRLVQHINAQTR